MKCRLSFLDNNVEALYIFIYFIISLYMQVIIDFNKGRLRMINCSFSLPWNNAEAIPVMIELNIGP